MIPFFNGAEPFFKAGPLQLNSFNIFIIVGILFATYMMRKYTERYGMDEDDMRWLGIRLVIFGFIGAHLVDVLFYTPERLAKDPWLLVKVWDGIASYGGFLGAALAFVFFAWRRGFHLLRWVDMVVYGFVPGMIFGRAACFSVHDHIGKKSDFVLAVDFPDNYRAPGFDGGPAHDLGFYEMLLWLALWPVVFALSRWEGRRPGTLFVAWALLYPPARFAMEYLRYPDTDPRYWGLTPAQYMAIGTFVFGLAMLGWLYTRSGAPLHEDARPSAEKKSNNSTRKRTGSKKSKRR